MANRRWPTAGSSGIGPKPRRCCDDTIGLERRGTRRLRHRRSRAGAEHQSLEQRVGRQPVRAVQPGAGRFAGGKQPGQRRPAPHVGVDAAHHVVRRRADRNRIARDVDADLRAHRRDRRKPLPHVVGVQVREGQKDAAAGPLRFADDAARHDVARRQIAIRMVARP